MSTTPSDQPQRPTAGAVATDLARLPIPGKAEFAVYLLVVLFLIILWAASDAVSAGDFALLLTVLTSFYMLSRGIAKASRVLEH